MIFLSAGCVSSGTTVSGAPFLAADESPRVQLDSLARRLLATAVTPADVLLQVAPGEPSTAWSGEYRGADARETYTWRYAVVHRFRAGFGVYNRADGETSAYALTATFWNSALMGVAVEQTELTEREREWLTHHLIAVGAAAVGTLIMLGAP